VGCQYSVVHTVLQLNMVRGVHGENIDLVKGQETQLGECIQGVTSSVCLATVEIAVQQTQFPACTTNLLEVVLVNVVFFFFVAECRWIGRI
jgi:hypothetical protein